MTDKPEKPEKPAPTCPLCQGTKHKREIVQLYNEKASQKKRLTALTCKRCSHVLMFLGGSNLYTLDAS